MNKKIVIYCQNCGDPIPENSYTSKRTCSVRCRVARQRAIGILKTQSKRKNNGLKPRIIDRLSNTKEGK